jgi:hypothetical protein
MQLATCTVLALALLGASDLERTTRAKACLDALVKQDFDAVGKDFDKKMKEVMPKEKLDEMWKAMTKQIGPFKKLLDTKTTKIGGADAVEQTCEFAKLNLTMRLSFNKDNEIQGMFFAPAKATKFDPPPYAKASSYREENGTINEGGEYPLGATFTLPKDKGPFACVILVHGSGPHDRDETLMANKPFRDLAWGLASRGVAVLRYEKRTYAHAEKMGKMLDTLTLKEETTDDVLAAAKLARKHKEIDPKKIFILGHSLGAMIAPQVGEHDSELGGLIFLAGNSRPLEDLVLEQFTYLYSLNGGPTTEQKADLEELKKKVQRIKDAKLTAETSRKELPLNLPPNYWKALIAYKQADTAAKLTMPILILHGERDYQVTMDDFAGWKKAVGGRKNVTLKSYPALNHLFMEGKGKSKPDEYFQAGHVAQEVIEDVAKWVKDR